MAWNDSVVTIVRVLINDMDTPYKNSTTKLRQVSLVAAFYVSQEINFSTNYSIDMATSVVSPDPNEIGDQTFINFVSLKTACLIDQGTFREKAALDGLEARCGMANLKISGHAEAFKQLLMLGACATYAELKKQYEFGDASFVHGIFSPFISDTFDPMDIFDIGDGRHRY